MIAFMGGLLSVFAALAVWMLAETPFLWQRTTEDDRPAWRLAIVGATLIASPIAGGWIGLEVMARLRPVRALDGRLRRSGRMAVAGVAAGILSAAGSAALLAFTAAWIPEGAVTGGTAMVFSALMTLPFARRRAGHCLHCGYDLRGGALRATCPECGAVGSAG